MSSYCPWQLKLIWIALLPLGWALPLAAQISPGPLARAHEQLEGVSKCATCHDFGAGKRVFKCLDCHTEIRRRVEARAGFHGRNAKPSGGQTECAGCHMEHNGRTFVLARIARAGFDHAAQTGLALEGTHRQQPCEACHNEKRIDLAARAEIKVKDANRSFLGLRRQCLTCHQDQHRGQLGTDCTHCHSQQQWKPAAGFNHAATSFPLTGLHQSVSCDKCHGPRSAVDAPHFKGLAAGGCQGCHADPHRGAFQEVHASGSCERCHTTAGWKSNRPRAAFRHDTTGFPLVAKHADAACSACHKGSDFKRPVAHAGCRDCHEDPHSGQFATRPAGSDCSSCHSQSSFQPSRFDRAMHDSAAFRLEGRHALLECGACHQPRGRGAVYLTGKLVCSACHQDRHGGQFAAVPYANRCDACHTTAGFQPSTFTATRHGETRFPLNGKHVTTACRDCHSASHAGREYQFPALSCAGCHSDPHRTTLVCETCHSTEQWNALRPFDHSGTGFRMEGAHREVACAGCHTPAVKTAPDLSKRDAQCFSCHAKTDPHQGQFQAADRTEDCATCHAVSGWKPPAFDHDKSRFPLDVAHRNVACARCHQQRTVGGRTVVTYRGISTECVQCHQR